MGTTDELYETEASPDLLGILKRRKGFLLLGLFLGCAGAAVSFLTTPKTYRSTMEILVGQRSGNLDGGSVDGMEQIGATTDVLSTHIQLFTSRRIVAEAVRTARLQELPGIRAAKISGPAVAGFVRSGLKLSRGGDAAASGAHTLQAAFEGPDPDDCAVILRAVFDEYVKYLQEHVEGTSGDAVTLLTALGTEHDDAVRNAETELRNFMEKTDLLWEGDAAKNIHKDRLKQLEANLATASAQRVNAKSRLSVIRDFLAENANKKSKDVDFLSLLGDQDIGRISLIRSIRDGDPEVAFDAVDPIRNLNANAEYSKILELVMQEDKLLEQFGESHPSVISVRKQMKTLRAYIDQTAGGLETPDETARMQPKEMLTVFVHLLENDVKEAEQRKKVLEAERRIELQQAKHLESAELKALALRNELNRQQTLSENTQAAIKGLNFVREYSGFSTDVIGDAVASYSPVSPIPTRLLLSGVLAGLAIGGLMAWAADWADKTFRDPDDVSSTLALPVFAHVPQFPKLLESKSEGLLSIDPTVYSFHRPRSAEAEVFRIIRTSVLCSIETSRTKIIQITSPQAGDGKSTTAANLAVSFAQSGRRTLLVDADLRRPRVAELFRIKRIPGLSEVLLDEIEPSDAIRETDHNDLSIVPSGRRPENPSELLGSMRFKDLLQIYAEQFDIVIVDTPPLLAVSDAAVVAQAVDAAILSLRIVKNGRHLAVRARRILDEHQATILGLVVNGFGASLNHYGYRDKLNKDSYLYNADNRYYTEAESEEPLLGDQPELPV